MQKRVERAALPSYMQEQVEKLEQAGYKVLETCQIDDTYTAGQEQAGDFCRRSTSPELALAACWKKLAFLTRERTDSRPRELPFSPPRTRYKGRRVSGL